MSVIRNVRYYPKHPLLKGMVKYFWFIQSENPVNIAHALLPVDNPDLILNLSEPISYGVSKQKTATSTPIHLNGIRDQPCLIRQTGKLEVMGVAFFSYGLYPLVQVPLKELINRSLDLNEVNSELAVRLEERVYRARTITERVATLEEELVRAVQRAGGDLSRVAELVGRFKNASGSELRRFCEHTGIHPRTLERFFQRHIGIGPKLYRRIHRFQSVVRHLVEQQREASLTELAYAHNYYDQSHFIREFKAFSGSCPSRFLEERKAVKTILG